MPVPNQVRNAFDQTHSLVEAVGEHVRQTLRPFAESQGYLYFDRLKTLESLSEKIETGRIERWSRIDDLFACTLVVPQASHEARVMRKLADCFTEYTVRSKGTAKKAPDVFRFDATRFYGKVSSLSAVSMPAGATDVIFEVQISTVFEYAWASVTHDLTYKGDTVDWRKQRLVAQLKASVEQIETVLNAFEEASGVVPQSDWPELDAKHNLMIFFQQLFDDKVLPDSIKPYSWRRFVDNVYALIVSYERNPSALSETVEALTSEISAYWRGPSSPVPPQSGSLFQLVEAHVARRETSGGLGKFVVVDSEELRTLYGVEEVPKPFIFDLPESGEHS